MLWSLSNDSEVSVGLIIVPGIKIVRFVIEQSEASLNLIPIPDFVHHSTTQNKIVSQEIMYGIKLSIFEIRANIHIYAFL